MASKNINGSGWNSDSQQGDHSETRDEGDLIEYPRLDDSEEYVRSCGSFIDSDIDDGSWNDIPEDCAEDFDITEVNKESSKLPTKKTSNKEMKTVAGKSKQTAVKLKYPKEDMIFIAIKLRKTALTASKLWGDMNNSELLQAIKDITDEELNSPELEERKKKRKEFAAALPPSKTKLKELKNIAKKIGLSTSGRTVNGVIDAFLDSNRTIDEAKGIELDEDQSQLVEKWDNEILVISAGPGSGKTTTLCALIARALNEQPDSRILVLAYNVNAQKIIAERLKKFGVNKLGAKNHVLKGEKGCFVLTFNKYAHQRLNQRNEGKAQPGDNPIDNILDEAAGTTFGKDGFCLQFEKGVAVPVGAGENWDWLVIDEAQDATVTHATLINKLKGNSKHIVVAGDPRQELYSGATWFSNLWAKAPEDQKQLLRYNHRSTPEIVTFLNSFSKMHFPTCHHDQISARQNPGDSKTGVRWELSPNIEGGATAAEILSTCPQGDGYVIVPVSVEKYNTGRIITSFRQEMFARKACEVIVLNEKGDDKSSIADQVCFVGTTFKLKGTERNTVVLLQPEAGYNISRTQMTKSIFVAISRARDNLHIVFGQKPDINGIFAKFTPPTIETATKKEKKEEDKITRIAKINDLVRLECWDTTSTKSCELKSAKALKAIAIPAKSDSDFVGIYAETCAASCAGVKLNVPIPTIVHSKNNTKYLGLVQENGVFNLYMKGIRAPEFKKAIDKLRKAFVECPQYAFAALNFVMSIETEWSLSNRFENDKNTPKAFSAYGDLIREWSFGDIPRFNGMIIFPVTAHRSDKTIGEIAGVPDFMTGPDGEITSVIEMKHATPSEAHRVQAALYATIGNLKSCLLVNSKTGTATSVQALDTVHVNDIARAKLALGTATAFAVERTIRLKYEAKSDIIVSVDIETARFCNGPEKATYITEIGAIAFQIGSDTIKSRFHRIGNGVSEGKSGDLNVETMLRVTSFEDLSEDQKAMRDEFAQWLSKTTKIFTFLQWGGDEKKMLFNGIESAGVIDGRTIFKSWLQKMGKSRAEHTSLEDAVGALFGPSMPFVPHRAYEDAVLAAAVFTTIINSDGAL